MGAGHCQRGGLTDQNICNIHAGAHLASAKNGASRSSGLNATGLHGRTDEQKARKYV